MTDTDIDPALVGIWLVPGQPQTYEITADGGYFVAEPDAVLRFQDEGAVMVWGGRRYRRVLGEGATPIGTWIEDETGDAWDFTDDNGYSVLSPAVGDDGLTFVGIWALRNHGTSLWACEKQAELELDGAHLSFKTSTGEILRYGYATDDGMLTLLDPETWTELSRYISAERMVRSART